MIDNHISKVEEKYKRKKNFPFELKIDESFNQENKNN